MKQTFKKNINFQMAFYVLSSTLMPTCTFSFFICQMFFNTFDKRKKYRKYSINKYKHFVEFIFFNQKWNYSILLLFNDMSKRYFWKGDKSKIVCPLWYKHIHRMHARKYKMVKDSLKNNQGAVLFPLIQASPGFWIFS